METEKKKTEGYILYMMTFIVLSVLTLIAVGITQVRISQPVLITLVLFIATIQTAIVLLYNMHLKFQEKILAVFVAIIFSIIFLTIVVTVMDYVFR